MMQDNKIQELRRRLLDTIPQHDTPVGLIHPYWARKPQNILTVIIETLTKEGDIVADPFMGSGTTIFAALAARRHAIGSDLNPLAVFIVNNTLNLGTNVQKQLESIDRFYNDLSVDILPWFSWSKVENTYIERERFKVEGAYENGNFSLVPTEVILKRNLNGKWTNRISISEMDGYVPIEKNNPLLHEPLDFNKIKLRHNSRIAIPRGAFLSHFFSDRNKAAINIALRKINSIKKNDISHGILKLLLSSSLPLLRLSDKKASSQWPYWRPKESLTSRNPIIMLSSRIKAFRKASDWLLQNIPNVHLVPPHKIFDNPTALSAAIFECSALSLRENDLGLKQVDLVVIDPPYADQAPYLEYSDLWLQLLNLEAKSDKYSSEIVKTDAPDRLEDSQKYSLRLEKSIEASFAIVKESGYLVLFYQDYDLQHWACIERAAKQSGFVCLDVVPLPKQRRSMKTVTSPGKTFDGDLVLVFGNAKVSKTVHSNENKKRGDINQECRSLMKELPPNTSLFEIYSFLIKSAFIDGWISQYAENSFDVRKAIKKATEEC